MEASNIKAMREALKEFVEYSNLVCKMGMFNRDRLVSITKKASDAISAPARNCDVGTLGEQSARFDDHCRKHMGCLTCPFREKDGGVPKHCEFAWSQMPYGKGGEK